MLTAITEAKVVIKNAKLLPKHEVRLRRQAIVRMTHSSTAIEGNTLDTKQVEALYANKKIAAPAREIYEVQNYLKALRYIEQVVVKKQKITQRIFLKIHKLVTNKTLPAEKSGCYRKESVYVVRRRFGSPDEIKYTAPQAKKVPQLSADLIKWIQESKKQAVNPIIVAGIVHQEVAAIHPFTDGNGRTARALATLILYQRNYDFRHLFALEDYYNRNRSQYYQAIDVGKNYEERRQDFTSWLEYFVGGFQEEIKNVKSQVISLSSKKVFKNINSRIYLEENQLRILDFIDQLGQITVRDVVDILKCPKRTAQFRLLKLKKLGIIKQVSKGPATRYILK